MHRWLRARWTAHARLLVVALLVAVAATVTPAAFFAGAQTEAAHVVAHEPGHQVITFPLDGRTRSYRLYVPPSLSPATPHALLVVLHSLHRTAASFERTTLLDRDAAANDAVVAYPDGTGRSWDAGTCCGYAVRHHVDDVSFVLRVVADVAQRVRIDPARIAVTGFSNGGLMSYRLVCERPDVFHAAVVVAGDVVDSRCGPSRPVSVLHVHGGRDRVIPLSGEPWSHLDASGFPPAAASAEQVAVADGCTGAVSDSADVPVPVVRWQATGCPDGARVELLTVDAMPHTYPTGASGAKRFGVDMSALTWSFLGFARPA
jgi:polyhydroxybutyrate depolymerase